jgi:hypothetical protein
MQAACAAAKPLHGNPTTKSTLFSRRPSNRIVANPASAEAATEAGSAFGASPCSFDEGRRMTLLSLCSM